MSYKNSNLYASRVFAEHPLALWSIDEDINFSSLISESAKEINEVDWTIFDGTIVESFISPPQNPIEDSPVSKVYLSSASVATVEIRGQQINYAEKIDTDKPSICFNFFIYIPNNVRVESIESGFRVGETYEYGIRNITYADFDKWIKIEAIKGLTENQNISPTIKVNYADDSIRSESDASIYISGVSVGQWSEPFNLQTTGIETVDLPQEIKDLIESDFPDNLKAVQLDPYGLNNEDIAYIIEYRGKLMAETSGIPMVYGSRSNVSILPRKTSDVFLDLEIDGQSNEFYSEVLFIESIGTGFPGSTFIEDPIDGGSSPSASYDEEISGGFFYSEFGIEIVEDYDSGTNDTLPLEFIYGGSSYVELNNSSIPSIVFPGKGFLNRSGIYNSLTVEFWMRVNNKTSTPFRIMGPLKSNDGLYVGAEFITVKVGKYIKSYFVGQWYRPMLVHFGQSLNEIFLMINGEKVISIPIDSLDIYTFPAVNQDYLGFYGTDKIDPFEIDSFSIFPYTVTEQIAKLRFAYGQSADNQEIVSTTFGGDLTYIDFPYTGYSSNISFPDMIQWSSGYFNNLKVDSNGLSLPNYSKPEISFTNIVNGEATSAGESELAWSNFDYENFLIQDEEYPFISLKPNESYENISGTIYFSTLNKTSYPTKSIYGILKTSGDVTTEQSILFITNINTTDTFEVKLVDGDVKYFYNDTQLKSASISASSAFAVGIDLEKISEQFPQVTRFFSNPEILSLNFAGSGSNTFTGKIFSLTLNNKFFTEKDNLFNSTGIADLSFTDDKYSYIGSYTFIPKITNSTVFTDIASSGYWEASIPMSYFGKYVTNSKGERVYDLDLIQFNIDIPSTFYSKENEDSIEYRSAVKTKSYITIQDVQNVGKIPYTNYVNTEIVGDGRVIDIDQLTDIDTTKYEVYDGTVIFSPKEVGNFTEHYITVHIYVTSSGINTENIRVKTMSLSSMAFDESSFYKIGTPTGRSVYPIVKTGDQYVYKRKNPVVVDIESGSYLYISGNSGLEVLPTGDTSLTKGVSFPINETLKSNFKVVGMQMYLMYNESRLFTEKKVFGKIYNNSKQYELLLEPEVGGKRAFIKVIDSITKQQIPGIITFLNGKRVTSIPIRPMVWNSIVISFQENSFIFNQEIGQLEIYSGFRVNNVALFADINEAIFNLRLTNKWFYLPQDDDDVDTDPETWSKYSSASTWFDVLDEQNIPVIQLSLNGEELFNTYSGLSYAVGDDSVVLNVNFDSINVLNDAEWTNFDIKPI